MQQSQIEQSSLTIHEKLAWLRLSRTENVGPVTFYRLIERYSTAEKALEALPDLAKRGGRKKPLNAPPLSVIEQEYDRLQKLGGDIVTAAEDIYPLPLSACDDAPPVLSYIGNFSLTQKSCIAMVGARNASVTGRKLAHKIAADLGQSGHIVTSGLARGIDTAAHHGALETGTIAVVAGGIDVVYPEENQKLYEEIVEKGLIIAESPLGQKPFAQSFPRRNRIVSGLSEAVVVVEATMRSGSLITARLAGEQGRDVFAVPGSPMDPRADGPNHLIRDGAVLVRNADDIREALSNFVNNGLREPHYAPAFDYTPSNDLDPFEEEPSENAQEMLINHLSTTPIQLDELIRLCDLTIPAIQTILLELEIAGRVKRLPGNRIALI